MPRGWWGAPHAADMWRGASRVATAAPAAYALLCCWQSPCGHCGNRAGTQSEAGEGGAGAGGGVRRVSVGGAPPRPPGAVHRPRLPAVVQGVRSSAVRSPRGGGSLDSGSPVLNGQMQDPAARFATGSQTWRSAHLRWAKPVHWMYSEVVSDGSLMFKGRVLAAVGRRQSWCSAVHMQVFCSACHGSWSVPVPQRRCTAPRLQMPADCALALLCLLHDWLPPAVRVSCTVALVLGSRAPCSVMSDLERSNCRLDLQAIYFECRVETIFERQIELRHANCLHQWQLCVVGRSGHGCGRPLRGTGEGAHVGGPGLRRRARLRLWHCTQAAGPLGRPRLRSDWDCAGVPPAPRRPCHLLCPF